MRSFMRISCFAFLLLITAPLFLSVTMLWKQKAHQEEMEEKLEAGMLVKLTIPTNEVRWYKAGKELIIDGRLFDVKHSVTQGDTVVFTGLFDETEDLIRSQFYQLVKGKAGKQINLLNVKFIFFPAFDEHETASCNPSWKLINNSYSKFSDKINDFPLSSLSPPPRA